MIYSLLLCLLVTGPTHEVLTEWKLDKTSDDIEISYRKIMVGDTFKTREIKVAFEITAPREDIIPFFQEPEYFVQWSAGVEECKLLEFEQSEWVLYNLYDMPWPFSERDVVTQYSLEQIGSTTTLYIKGQSDLYPEIEDVFRIKKYEGYWQLKQVSETTTQVEFHSIALYKPVAPRFIQDPIIQSALIRSMDKLKSMIATRG